MKTIQIFIFSTFLIMSNVVFAQEIELKGTNNTYIQKEMQGIYGVWNKSNKLDDIIPSYLCFEHIPTIGIKNKSKLDAIIDVYLSPFFKRYGANLKSTSILYFYFYADINGIIKEMYMSYPKEIGIIPITSIEKLESEILNSEVRLIFDKNNRIFNGSIWIGRGVGYDPNDLRKN